MSLSGRWDVVLFSVLFGSVGGSAGTFVWGFGLDVQEVEVQAERNGRKGGLIPLTSMTTFGLWCRVRVR